MTAPRDPETPAEWQIAVDAAWALLLLDAARQYGLVTGGPAANVDRCAAILAEGKRRGYTEGRDRSIAWLLNKP